ncbi:gibberellin 2-beta-dioxygenase 8-like [Vigna radiata var. radiata]|uniref:Gibberellin 2-beta-dioxygenase 8-like n=1 Tax=Vigna radiata var. radiata TaxID=3916 RepID=A0A1S3TZM8_VIGRR|nr:gibberellin 2-beta-dioxygenase 8-like [Vigna radiata var. radiata]
MDPSLLFPLPQAQNTLCSTPYRSLHVAHTSRSIHVIGTPPRRLLVVVEDCELLVIDLSRLEDRDETVREECKSHIASASQDWKMELQILKMEIPPFVTMPTKRTRIGTNRRSLALEPHQLKKKKKKKGGSYNLRKSLAWNRAFFTKEGVWNLEELSMISGIASSKSGLDSEVKDIIDEV